MNLEKGLAYVGFGSFVVVFAGVVAIGVAIIEGWISGPVGTALATVLLVFITGIYAAGTMLLVVETVRSRKESERSRKELVRSRQQAVRPVIEFTAEEKGSKIENVGNGPALDVGLSLTLNPDGKSHGMSIQHLDEGENVTVPVEPLHTLGDRRFVDIQMQAEMEKEGVPEKGEEEEFWEDFENSFESLSMEGEMRDILGNSYSISKEYELWELTEGEGGYTDQSLDNTFQLYQISNELKKIRLHLTGEEDHPLNGYYRDQSEDPREGE